MSDIRTCAHCGADFRQRRKNHKFCTPKCATDAYNASRSQGPAVKERPGAVKVDEKGAIAQLESAGYVVHKPRPQEPVHQLDLRRVVGKDRIRIAVLSCTHFGSTHQQLTYLRQFYQYAEKEAKVSAFLHAGDVVDGPHQMHRDAAYNLFRHGYAAQRDYVVEVYPESKLPTYMISGNHDYGHTNTGGGYIVKDICKERDDLKYLGEISAHLDIGGVKIHFRHDFKGGSYALSYGLQKTIEGMASEVKPHLLFVGNYHKAIQIPSYRNVAAFLLASFQSQTPFMLGKGLESVIGGWIVEFGTDPNGIAGALKTEFVRFPQPLNDDWK